MKGGAAVSAWFAPGFAYSQGVYETAAGLIDFSPEIVYGYFIIFRKKHSINFIQEDKQQGHGRE